jgi:hypothetical protein
VCRRGRLQLQFFNEEWRDVPRLENNQASTASHQ